MMPQEVVDVLTSNIDTFRRHNEICDGYDKKSKVN